MVGFVFFRIIIGDEVFFDISFGDMFYDVIEFFDYQFGGVGIQDIVLVYYLILFYEQFDYVDGVFGYVVGEIGNVDCFWYDDFVFDFFVAGIWIKVMLFFVFVCMMYGCKRVLMFFIIVQNVLDGQFVVMMIVIFVVLRLLFVGSIWFGGICVIFVFDVIVYGFQCGFLGGMIWSCWCFWFFVSWCIFFCRC